MAKDLTVRIAVDLQQRIATWTQALTERARGAERDAGAGFVEYAGLMILIAGIFTLIDQLGLGGKISQAIGNAVNDVIGS